MPVRFTWDSRKALANREKHGVSFEEAVTAFEDPLGAFWRDLLHPERMLLVGISEQQRLLVVVHVEVAEDATRIISARRATPHERRRYEEDT
ncbi:MAG: BrnT family toxin [Deltaproteobacteria bacterium]|nr:BrnT family toxin [Deltaproteobacteria bacterium]